MRNSRWGNIPVQYARAEHAPADEDNIKEIVPIREGMTVWFINREYLEKAVELLCDAKYTLEVNYRDNSFYVVKDARPKTTKVFDVTSGRFIEV